MDLYSEPYRPEGNIDARAARRALSQSRFSHWALFLRETLQNSWDARRDDVESIDFRVDAFWPSGSQLAALQNDVFAVVPPRQALEGDELTAELPLLVVTDYGTRGLAGPTRADLLTTEKPDFVDFVRNVGRAADKHLGGGTYGFGKGVLYDSSICSTVIFFTRTRVAGQLVARLMAVRLGSSYHVGNQRFTGRHWWGVLDAVTGAEPVTGMMAEQLAERLGLTYIPRHATGTSIMVVGPIVEKDEDTLDDIIGEIRDAAMWWAWPHMIGGKGGPTIRFQFVSEGNVFPLPDVSKHELLAPYVEAYTRANDCELAGEESDAWPWVVKSLASRSGRGVRLGSLAYRRRPLAQSEDQTHSDPAVGNHLALLRAPRFVVKYLGAPADPLGNGVAGVFIADPALDPLFALSEPVSHDDWVPSKLAREKYQRNEVKQTLDRLRRELQPDVAQTLAVAGERGGYVGLAALSSTLGGLIDGLGGGVDARRRSGDRQAERVAITPEPSGGPSGVDGCSLGRHRSVKGSARLTGGVELRIMDGVTAAGFSVAIPVPEGRTIRVSAEPRVVVDGGTESPDDGPIGVAAPEVLGWTGEMLKEGLVDEFEVAGAMDGQVQVWIGQPADMAVTVVVTYAVLEK